MRSLQSGEGRKTMPSRIKDRSKAPECSRKEKICFVPVVQGTRMLKTKRGLKLDRARLHVGELGRTAAKKKKMFSSKLA